ncbi:hypothetical protein CR194_01260 [Salipaludibacillus keqinensis]|uniref:Uncharacterized protein n=1 Tax=Salipaludibacillus keqinensis TaxID=2045207 RepID=A0A323TX82_9BACI|nr:Ger(x)C family spore germination protein [Salipaludibacillus keqinensis]PYZ94195.1 hypothetical protein CR194_01260 [Salipaludibacillus keqinensis]
MKIMLVFLIIFTAIFCSGCWDARQLRDLTVLKSVGVDLTEDDKIELTVSSPISEKHRTAARSQIFSTIGDTPRNARINLESEVSESIDASKLRAVLINEEIAKEDIYPPLDVFYRDPRSALAAKLLISKVNAKEIVQLTPEDRERTSEILGDIIQAAENQTMVPITNIQLICPDLFDLGKDAVIPYVTIKEDAPKLVGVALFNNLKMTGTLSLKESSALLLMQNQLNKKASLTEQVHSDEDIQMENFISFNIEEVKRDMEVIVNKHTGTVDVPLNLQIEVNVLEYPLDDLDTQEKLNALNDKLSARLTEQFGNVINKLQESNCDALGIGRRVHAFEYSFWKEHDWQEIYPKVNFQISVEVEIVRHGILF